MIRLFSHKNRRVAAGAFPLERIRRVSADNMIFRDSTPEALEIEAPHSPLSIRNAMREYIDIMGPHAHRRGRPIESTDTRRPG